MVKENQLIDKALDAFLENTGIKFNVLQYEPFIENNRRADAVIQMNNGHVAKEYYVEAKKWLTTQNMGNMINQLKTFPGKGLLITDYVNPNIAEKLKDMDIPFIDIAGNAYINEPPVYIYIKGNKKEGIEKKEKPTRAFQQTGLKVVFAFLCNEDLVNEPYRKISELTKVAVGTVGWLIYDLKRDGFLIDTGKKKKLYDKEKLFNRWVGAYNERLRPKLRIGTYNTVDLNFWKDTDIKKYNAYWGGETAGYLYTKYLKQQVTTIYMDNTKGNVLRLITEKRLKEYNNGNVEIYEKFWGDELQINFDDKVHPILVYADLVATGDPRNMEIAKMVYKDEIDRLIRE